MRSEKLIFGYIEDRTVYQYTLENDNGMIVKIINYGATITSVTIPSGSGNRIELVRGFDTLEGYFSEDSKTNAPYFGCTVGCYVGRIMDGRSFNNGPDQLHGTKYDFNRRIWRGELIQRRNSVGVKLKHISPHIEESSPGNLDLTISILLTPGNEIHIKYKTVTDHESVESLTNHTYFNLNGFTENILKHTELKNSKVFLKTEKPNVPAGFEHFYVFDNKPGELDEVAMFRDPDSGRSLRVSTTEQGMMLFAGLCTPDKLSRESGDQYGHFRAICCESVRYPNGPNIGGTPSSRHTPREACHGETVFAFSW